MKNLKIGLFIAICLVQNNYAQTNKESEIIISEENLISLINTIKQKRDSIFIINEKKNIALQNQKTTNKLSSNTIESSSNIDYDLVMSRMAFLESKLDYLTQLIQKQNSTQSNIVHKYVPTQPVYKNNTQLQNNDNTYLLNKIKDLEKELNEVKKSQSNEKKLAEVSNKASVSKTTTDELPKASIKSNPISPTTITNNYNTPVKVEPAQKAIRDTIVIVNKEAPDYDNLVKTHSGISHKIFFDNNSAVINSSYFDTLDQLVILCNSNSKIDIQLKGFASKTGNVSYNEKLSLERTESVKKYLIEKGIHPSRILSQHHGIDYASKKNENARRVTINYVIRK